MSRRPPSMAGTVRQTWLTQAGQRKAMVLDGDKRLVTATVPDELLVVDGDFVRLVEVRGDLHIRR